MRRKLLAFALLLAIGSGLGIAGYLYSQQTANAGARGATVSLPIENSFRILMGLTDTQPTDWSGTISVSPGTLVGLEGWGFRTGDTVNPPAAWTANTQFVGKGKTKHIAPVGVVVSLQPWLNTASVTVKINRLGTMGKFSFNLNDVYAGKPKSFLTNSVLVEQTTGDMRLTSGPAENDFPAAALAPDGTTWIAYVAYGYGTDNQGNPQPPLLGSTTQQPTTFDFLVPQGNGDQVRLAQISADGTTFTDVTAVTLPGQDVMRPAIAVDNNGTVWIVWSQNVKGNWDLYACSYHNGQLSPIQRLTNPLGPDIAPALARSDVGTIWLTWQGFRNGRSEIFLSALLPGTNVWVDQGTVSDSPWNNWDPAIACAHDGSIYVVWDTYDKGDYDVRMRRYVPGRGLGPVIPVADTPDFEARASVVCDPQSHVWVAYEDGPQNWGKDSGVEDYPLHPGNPLFVGHTVKVRVFVNGQPYDTAGDVSASFQPKNQKVQRSFPRLGTNKTGQVYLTFRQTFPGLTVPVGSVWLSYITTYDMTHNAWVPAQLVPDSDGVSDNRPAIVPYGSALGQVALIHVSDGRSHNAYGINIPHNDLYIASSAMPWSNVPPQLVADSPPPPHNVSAPTKAERQDVANIRNYRAQVGGVTYQLLRGDYHRHTELSFDGGGDGPLVDMFRYALDAAMQDWICAGDHDFGGAKPDATPTSLAGDWEYTWWQIQKHDDAFHVGPQFVPLFGCERSNGFPDGHRNTMFVQRGIRPLPRLILSGGGGNPQLSPKDTKMLYSYLEYFKPKGITASHTSATKDYGTNWRSNDEITEPVVEIYQGDRQNYEYDGAPRAPTINQPKKWIGEPNPAGFVWNAFAKGYKFGFEASSDHHSTHVSYGVAYATAPTRPAIVDAFRKRHTYAATDNIIVDVRCGNQMMGDAFTTTQAPSFHVMAWSTSVSKFTSATLYEDNKQVMTWTPNPMTPQKFDFTWTDNTMPSGTQHYYYFRFEQADGQLAWASPMWITY
jgi:hypothetical protein